MRRRSRTLICQIITSIFALLFVCEYLIYYIAIFQCSWPKIPESDTDEALPVEMYGNDPVKAIFITDIQLLIRGHWFDNLRREWQMKRAFQTAVQHFEPEVVFILGDIFAQGEVSSDEEFKRITDKFKLMFKVPEDTKIYFVAGNHDIGFHYDTTEYLHNRFMKAFDAPPVRLVTIKGNHFVLINSMAMEGDGCFLCRPADLELNRISKNLKCAKGIGKCPTTPSVLYYSRPIVLQHFPMYRESDEQCSEPDEAPEAEKKMDFYEGRDCLSKETTQLILDYLNPRLILGGHTHHGCHVVHRKNIHEYTLASFNWRHKNNPNFLMGVFSTTHYAVNKCYIPQESTVIFLYCVGFIIILIFGAYSFRHPRWHYKSSWK